MDVTQLTADMHEKLQLNPEWTDITQLVRDVTAKMTPGEMLKLESFTLQEAMMAIEVDSCVN